MFSVRCVLVGFPCTILLFNKEKNTDYKGQQDRWNKCAWSYKWILVDIFDRAHWTLVIRIWIETLICSGHLQCGHLLVFLRDKSASRMENKKEFSYCHDYCCQIIRNLRLLPYVHMYMSLFMFTACPQLVSHMHLVMSHYHISFPCSLQCKTRCVLGYENARGGWGQFCMGDAVLPCQSLLPLFPSLCRWILDEPQLGCFWHWGSWDSEGRFSDQVPWHVAHTLLSNLHWGAWRSPPTMLNTEFGAQHNWWIAGGRWCFPVELFHSRPTYNPFILLFFSRGKAVDY